MSHEIKNSSSWSRIVAFFMSRGLNQPVRNPLCQFASSWTWMVSGSHRARSVRQSVRMFSRSAAVSSVQCIWTRARKSGSGTWKKGLLANFRGKIMLRDKSRLSLLRAIFFFSVVAKKKICLTKVNMVRIEGSCTNSNFRNKPLVYSS